MQGNLTWVDTFAPGDIAHQLRCPLATFVVIDLPANDLAAIDVHEQIQIEKRAFNSTGQVGNVPAVQLIWLAGLQCLRAA